MANATERQRQVNTLGEAITGRAVAALATRHSRRKVKQVGDTKADEDPGPGGPLNDQVRDALNQINACLSVDRELATATAYQTIAHAIALAMQNAVAQQQHGYMLRNALTSAAVASAILDGKKEEAEAILKMAESKIVSPGLAGEVSELLSVLRGISEDLRKMHATPGPAAATEPPTPSR